jgi:hypothetical protein
MVLLLRQGAAAGQGLETSAVVVVAAEVAGTGVERLAAMRAREVRAASVWAQLWPEGSKWQWSNVGLAAMRAREVRG